MNAAARKFGLATQRGLSASFHVLVAPARIPEHVFACRSRPHETTAVGEEIAPNWKFSAAIPWQKPRLQKRTYLPPQRSPTHAFLRTITRKNQGGRATGGAAGRPLGPPASGYTSVRLAAKKRRYFKLIVVHIDRRHAAVRVERLGRRTGRRRSPGVV